MVVLRLAETLDPFPHHLLELDLLEQQLLHRLAHLGLPRLKPLESRRLRVLALLGLIRVRTEVNSRGPRARALAASTVL